MKKRDVFIFPDGARLDLNKVVGFNKIDKDQFNNIVLPVLIRGTNKPYNFVLGYAHGKASENTKSQVQTTINELINRWEHPKKI